MVGCLGFRARWLAPICFLSTNSSRIYHIYRAFFTRYCCRLHSIDDTPGSVLSLCQARNPEPPVSPLTTSANDSIATPACIATDGQRY